MIGIRIVDPGDPLNIVKDCLADFQRTGGKATDNASNLFLDKVRAKLSEHIATSGPGQPPAMETGELMNSFRKLPLWSFSEVFVGGIYSDHPGASRLEWGRVDVRGIRTFPHPYLDMAARDAEVTIDGLFDSVVNDDAMG